MTLNLAEASSLPHIHGHWRRVMVMGGGMTELDRSHITD